MIPGVLRPCLACGVASDGSWCEEHRSVPERRRDRPSYRDRGYTAAWDRLSRRARARQPLCSTCQATTGLTVDHLPSAWWRAEHGLPVTLRDVVVLCGPCNSRAGSSRPGSPRYVEWEATR